MGTECDLHRIVFDENIDGKVLKENLNESWTKSTFNKNIKDGKHKFKKATIKYLMESMDDIDETWSTQKVFKFLYFAECAIIQNAIISKQIDGAMFDGMDSKEWS